jgi:hypothetical protein
LAIEIAESNTNNILNERLTRIIEQLNPIVNLVDELRRRNDEYNRNAHVNEAIDDLI